MNEKTEESAAAGRDAFAKQADANQASRASQEADREAEQSRAGNVTVNNPRAPDRIAEQHRKVDEFNEKRNEENRPGHQVNMEKEEAKAEASTKATEGDRPAHVPTGKQQNRNTPRVLPDGTKVWDQ